MRVGIGLPVTTKGTDGGAAAGVGPAGRGGGFDVLTSIDRIVYPGFER